MVDNEVKMEINKAPQLTENWMNKIESAEVL